MKIYNDVTIIIIYAFLDLNFGVYMKQKFILVFYFKAQFFKESFLNREKTYRAEPSFKK